MKNKIDHSTSEFMTSLAESIDKTMECSIVAKTMEDITSSIKFWLPSGLDVLDWAIGKGYPCGRIVEIFGKESQGKTALALTAIAMCQELGGIGVFIDKESTFDTEFAKLLGVDLSRLIYIHEQAGKLRTENKPGLLTVERVIEILQTTIDNTTRMDENTLMVIVWDSIAATPSNTESLMDTRKEGIRPGQTAQCIGLLLRRLTERIAGTRILCLFINQIRDTFAMFGAKTESPGGHALKSHASVRLELHKAKLIKDGNNPVGIDGAITVVKNKVGIPFRSVGFKLYFERGFHSYESLIEHLIEHEKIKTGTKGWVSWVGKNYRVSDLAELLVGSEKDYEAMKSLLWR